MQLETEEGYNPLQIMNTFVNYLIIIYYELFYYYLLFLIIIIIIIIIYYCYYYVNYLIKNFSLDAVFLRTLLCTQVTTACFVFTVILDGNLTFLFV